MSSGGVTGVVFSVGGWRVRRPRRLARDALQEPFDHLPLPLQPLADRLQLGQLLVDARWTSR